MKHGDCVSYHASITFIANQYNALSSKLSTHTQELQYKR